MASMHTGNTERLAFGNYTREQREPPPDLREHRDLRHPHARRFDVDDDRRTDDYRPVRARSYVATDPGAHVDAHPHGAVRPLAALVGRILLASIFAVSGAAKLLHTETTIAYMTGAGIPRPDILVYVAAGAELLGAAALILGLLGRAAAVGLTLFLIPTTLLFHHFWDLEGTAALTQQVNFIKNAAIIGGLLVLAACGPGRYSIDHARHRRRAFAD